MGIERKLFHPTVDSGSDRSMTPRPRFRWITVAESVSNLRSLVTAPDAAPNIFVDLDIQEDDRDQVVQDVVGQLEGTRVHRPTSSPGVFVVGFGTGFTWQHVATLNDAGMFYKARNPECSFNEEVRQLDDFHDQNLSPDNVARRREKLQKETVVDPEAGERQREWFRNYGRRIGDLELQGMLDEILRSN